MAKLTQRDRIKEVLYKNGVVSRNEVLAWRPMITRLSGIIQVLEEEGFVFTTKEINQDFYYKMIKSPWKTVSYTLPSGRIITNIIK